MNCESLHAYLDGELSPEDRLAFEAHLASCEACRAELPKLLALMAVLEDAMAAPAQPKLSVVSGGDGPPTVQPVPPKPLARRRRPLWLASVGVALAAAAAIAIALWPTTQPPQPQVSTAAPIAIALGPTRTNEWRTSYPGTDAHRPRDVARGAASSESISLMTLASLEQAKAYDGLAVASLLSGDRERAVRAFAQAPHTPDVDSDRAALELADGGADALVRALDDVDRALSAEPNNPRALWNRALVLIQLKLESAAALDFERVAALNEPGWAKEAADRAKLLRETVQQRHDLWEKANAAGQQLIKDGTPVPSELVTRGAATLLHRSFYDAVRAAPSRERVEALLPVAQAIDRAYGTNYLADYVRRIAISDFRVRKPLSDGYRELMRKGTLPTGEAEAFLHRLEASKADDIWLGAINWLGRISAHLDDYHRRAEAIHDPWFVAIAEQETAKAESARGENLAAERRLHEAITAARRDGIAYRVVGLDETLASLHDGARHLSQVANDRQTQYRDAITAGEWRLEMNALLQLVGVNQDRFAHNLTRAYLSEFLDRLDRAAAVAHTDQQYDCPLREYGYQSLAAISLLLGETARARQEVAAIPGCGDEAANTNVDARRTSKMRTIILHADLYRAEHRDEDARFARDHLDELRRAPSLSTEHQVWIAFLDGQLLEDTDRAAAQRSLRKAIGLLGNADDGFSIKLRAYAFSELAIDASRAGQFADVLSVLAETLGVRRPERCALAIAVSGKQTALAYVDADGQTGGQIVMNPMPGELDVDTLVPTATSAKLRTCGRVAVMSRAPVLGAGRLLPAEIAWSYLLKTTAAPSQNGLTQRRVIIDNPDPPADLKLPALNPYLDGERDGAQLLRGADATPTRVLQAITTASVIEFHTHGIIANDVSEASYLVLSPELDRRYALTPSDVAQVKLVASPLVILGACHAATSSRSLEGGIGLAEAFLGAGARAVIASPDSVPDLGARAFFNAVRERVLHGADPAVAVRDERVQRLSLAPGDAWLTGVVVFEQ